LDQITGGFESFKPTVVINTAAYTQVDHCEKDAAACRSLNVDAVQNLVEVCLKYNTKLIHLSTDFVFDGEKGNYVETDVPNPLSVYAKSKFDAENLVIHSGLKNWVVARTMIIYGVTENMSRSNVVLWAKSSLEKGEVINVVDDQFRAPTLAEDLAVGCLLLIENDANGIYHLSGPERFSILELVKNVADYFGLDQALIRSISTASLNQAAKRPPITGFDISKAIRDLNYQPRTFSEGLKVVEEQLAKL